MIIPARSWLIAKSMPLTAIFPTPTRVAKIRLPEGTIFDAEDGAQIQEMVILGDLARRARDAGVQVMIEGPGHVPLNRIAGDMRLQKKVCGGAPYYVLGPLPTDIAAGYDHISGAIGGAIAAANGADFLCYVTPAEHLTLPGIEEVREGVVASKIAAHIGDLEKGIQSAWERDRKLSEARIGFTGLIKGTPYFHRI